MGSRGASAPCGLSRAGMALPAETCAVPSNCSAFHSNAQTLDPRVAEWQRLWSTREMMTEEEQTDGTLKPQRNLQGSRVQTMMLFISLSK